MNSELAHKEVLDLIPAYVAGGLTGAELAAFESHVRDCAPCAAVLRQLQETDLRMGELFANERPDMGFEDRVVKAVRQGSRRIIRPALARVAAGMAAALVLGSVGVAGNYMVEHGGLAGLTSKSSAVGYSSMKKLVSPASDSTLGEVDAKERIASPDEVAHQNIERFHSDRSWQEQNEARQRTRSDVNGPAAENGRGEATRISRPASPPPAAMESDSRDAKTTHGKSDLYSEALRNGFQQKVTAGDDASGRYDNGFFYNLNGSSSGLGTQAAVPNSGGTAGGTEGDGKLYLGQTVAGLGGQAGAGKPVMLGTEFRPTQTKAPEAQFFKMSDLAQTMNAENNQLVAGRANTPAEDKPADGQSQVEAGKMRVDVRLAHIDGRLASAADKADGKDPAEPGDAAGVTIGQATPLPESPKPPAPQQSRKIVRNGEIEFQVDSFDSAFVTISKIVTEQGGYVQSSSSDKLANGKVRGTVVVRVPPDQLDTLILKLRALGDLKSQKISAQDVTKVYFDLEGELKAARAMEERLLNIIKTGKGEIKDLIEAEKQLGVYREKIEKLEGEIRYYNNLVSLSTLSISLTEKDIRAAAFAQQHETVSMGMESEDVEKSRTDALKAIDEAKGRVIESNLKKYDAGQLAATIVAEVSPDAAGPLIDRFKQIGRVSRLDIDRKQTAPGEVPAGRDLRVEKKDTRFSISIYNLANVAPRQTSNVNLAVDNVEDAYKSILKLVETSKGRIVTSTLNRQKPEQTTATINFEVPSAAADAALTELRRDRDVMSLSVTENPDTNNVTTAKRGFVVQVYSLATVPARRSETILLSTRQSVTESFNKLLDQLSKAGARVVLSQLNDQDRSNIVGSLEIEVMKDKEADVRTALGSAGEMIARSVSRSPDTANTVDSKVRLCVQVISFDRLTPRETQRLNLAAKDVPASYYGLLSSLRTQGARIITSQLNEQNKQDINAVLDFEIPTDKDQRPAVEKTLAAAGVVYGRDVTRAADGQLVAENKLRMTVKLISADQLEPREKSTLMIKVADVDKAASDTRDAALKAGGRIISSQQNAESSGQTTTRLVADVPLDQADTVRSKIKNLGAVRVAETSTNPQTPDGSLARARLEVTLANADMIVANDQGLGASVKHALSMSVKGLLWTVQVLVMGILLLGPWVLIAWLIWRAAKKKPATPAT